MTSDKDEQQSRPADTPQGKVVPLVPPGADAWERVYTVTVTGNEYEVHLGRLNPTPPENEYAIVEFAQMHGYTVQRLIGFYLQGQRDRAFWAYSESDAKTLVAASIALLG